MSLLFFISPVGLTEHMYALGAMKMTVSKPNLDVEKLCIEAKAFACAECEHNEPYLYGVTDGKAVGTYLELKFRKYLLERYTFREGNAAKGIDFPDLEVDIKVTSIKQPQSSCPFKSARQKVYGLGYSLLVFVYDKTDDGAKRTSNLKVLHTIFVEKQCTADYQLTRGLIQILEQEGNEDDIAAYIIDKNLPLDEIGVNDLAEEIISTPPAQGYLTISNALQWRLQYRRIIAQADKVEGIHRIS